MEPTLAVGIRVETRQVYQHVSGCSKAGPGNVSLNGPVALREPLQLEPKEQVPVVSVSLAAWLQDGLAPVQKRQSRVISGLSSAGSNSCRFEYSAFCYAAVGKMVFIGCTAAGPVQRGFS